MQGRKSNWLKANFKALIKGCSKSPFKLVLGLQCTPPFTTKGLANGLSLLASGDTLFTRISVHVEILQDTFSHKNVGSKMLQWQFITDICVPSTIPTKPQTFYSPKPPCVPFQETFHHNKIADNQILQAILILPVKDHLPAVQVLIFCVA